MDPQSFLQSGLLETYVLGQCTESERNQVERMLADYPELKAELEAIELSLEKMALANAVPPPPGLKAQTLEHIRRETAGKPETAAAPQPRWLAWALCGALALLLGILYYRSAGERQRRDERFAALQTELDDCRTRNRQDEKNRQLIALLRDRDTRSVILADGPQPKTTALVWHNPKRAETALDINSLPAPNTGQYFQFWAIVDGKPLSMGMVDLHGDGSWQALPFIPGAQAFAISAENNPNGSATPTLVLMIGKV